MHWMKNPLRSKSWKVVPAEAKTIYGSLQPSEINLRYMSLHVWIVMQSHSLLHCVNRKSKSHAWKIRKVHDGGFIKIQPQSLSNETKYAECVQNGCFLASVHRIMKPLGTERGKYDGWSFVTYHYPCWRHQSDRASTVRVFCQKRRRWAQPLFSSSSGRSFPTQ